jgi:selenide, water dikinase
LLCDAQTSGGLLIAVATEDAGRFIAALEKQKTPVAACIGRLVDGPAGRARVVP